VTKRERARQKQQTPICLWLTGIPATRKSTIANLLEESLFKHGCHTYVLDGDIMRNSLNRDLGFTESDRIEKCSTGGRSCPPSGGCWPCRYCVGH
jgi:adenylylsulfate kinase-like enzyme